MKCTLPSLTGKVRVCNPVMIPLWADRKLATRFIVGNSL